MNGSALRDAYLRRLKAWGCETTFEIPTEPKLPPRPREHVPDVDEMLDEILAVKQ